MSYTSSESRATTLMDRRRSVLWTCICWWTLTILLGCHTEAMGTDDKGSLQTAETTRPLQGSTDGPSNQGRHKACPSGSGIVSPHGKVHCCKNGGVPLLGTLCACPRNYDGRWCERRRQSCLRIPHGHIFRDDCTICRCMYGILSCISNAFKNCESDDTSDNGSFLRSYDTRKKHAKSMQRLISNSELLTKVASSGASTNYSYTFITTLVVVSSTLWRIKT